MNVKTMVIILLLMIVFCIYLFKLISKKEIELKNSLPWFALMCLVTVFVIFPRLLDFFSKLIGIYEPVNFIFFSGFCILLYMIFSITRQFSKQMVAFRKLVQKVALEKKRNEK